LKTVPDFLVCKELSAVKLAQAGFHLLPEPSVVIDVVFHKLLNVLIRAAPVLSRHTVQLLLQFRGEMYFHRF